MTIREKIAARKIEQETKSRRGFDDIDWVLIRAGAMIVAGQIIGAVIGHILTRG